MDNAREEVGYHIFKCAFWGKSHFWNFRVGRNFFDGWSFWGVWGGKLMKEVGSEDELQIAKGCLVDLSRVCTKKPREIISVPVVCVRAWSSVV